MAREQTLSKRVLSIRERAIELLERVYRRQPRQIFDRYGRVHPDVRERLVHRLFTAHPRSVEEELMGAILEDILLISPWTYPDEYTSSYYLDNRVSFYCPYARSPATYRPTYGLIVKATKSRHCVLPSPPWLPGT